VDSSSLFQLYACVDFACENLTPIESPYPCMMHCNEVTDEEGGEMCVSDCPMHTVEMEGVCVINVFVCVCMWCVRRMVYVFW
jgi:hypothetical protein